MKIERKIEIEVTPFISKNGSVENAERIGNAIKFFGKSECRNVKITDYRICDNQNLLILVENVGNAVDQLTMLIAGVEKQEDEYHFLAVERAKSTVRVISDDEAEKIMKQYSSEFSELNSDLTSIYS